MIIPVEIFSVTITNTPESTHAWTEELFRTAMESVNRIWQSQAGISFTVETRFTRVTMAAGDFPGGDNWQSETLLAREGAERYSLLTEQALCFAVSYVNRNHARANPFQVRIHLLPCRSRSVSWAGRAVRDRAECYCPRPLGAVGDRLADILIAHELGHILLGPGHHPMAQNLMFMEQSTIMRPPQLDEPQRQRVASSPLVTHWRQQTTSCAPHPTTRSFDPRERIRGHSDPARAVAYGGAPDSGGLLGAGSSRGPLGTRRNMG